MKKLTIVNAYILRIEICGLFGLAIDLILLLLYSVIQKGEVFFLLTMIVILIAALIVAFCNAYKYVKKYKDSPFTKVIDAYDESKGEIERFSNVESKILRESTCIDGKNIRDREMKMAYILKAQIDADISVLQTTSVLGIIITLVLKLLENQVPCKSVLYLILLVILFFFLISLIIYVPREKYIASVCEKIIKECKE